MWGSTGRFTALTLRSVPAGATVRVTCKGKGCRKKKIVKKVRKATSRYKLAKLMRRNNRLRPRALVEVRVTAPQPDRQGVPVQDPQLQGALDEDALPAARCQEAQALFLNGP